MKRYVVGFAFTEDHAHVVLIRKTRPVWQSGRFNGIGGKVEPGENFPEAMAREAREEAGLDLDWRHYATYFGPDYEMRIFVAISNTAAEARTMTDEEVHIVAVSDVPNLPTIGNLRWFIPLALDPHVKLVTASE